MLAKDLKLGDQCYLKTLKDSKPISRIYKVVDIKNVDNKPLITLGYYVKGKYEESVVSPNLEVRLKGQPEVLFEEETISVKPEIGEEILVRDSSSNRLLVRKVIGFTPKKIKIENLSRYGGDSRFIEKYELLRDVDMEEFKKHLEKFNHLVKAPR